MKQVTHIIFFLCVYTNFIFSQQNTKSTFNFSYWNSFADKRHLTGKERAEFIGSHQKLNSATPSQNTNPLQYLQKDPLPQNNILSSPCINADFEAGNLTGWTPTSGFNPIFNMIGCCPNGGGQQTIMSGAGLDPFGSFPVVLPGGNFSLRIGNSVNGGEADRIEQTFLVSPANANFSYKYAVVLQDPNHALIDQPYFQVEMLDTLNNQVPCTFYYVAAGQNIPGFFNSPTPGVIYKPWTTVLVDLTPYIGQNITIRFSTFDCSLGGHFGYAYIDGVCQSFIGGGSATVCAGATQTFCAPAGLASYTWNGPGVNNFVGQCVNASAPGVYTVTTTLITNCVGPPFTYTLYNQPAPIPNAGPNVTVCANNNLVSLSGSITGFSSTPQWSSSGTGVFTSTANLVTTYSPSIADVSAGSVIITLSTLNNGLCPPASSTLQVTIIGSPTVNAGANQNICSNLYAPLNGTITGPTNTGIWTSSGSGTFNPSPNLLVTNYLPSPADILAGSVTLTLTSTGNGFCNAVSSTVSIAFTQIATVTAVGPQNICSSTGSVSLTGTITGGTSTGSWSSSGSGTYNPGPGQINSVYFITPGDIGLGTLIFSLSSTNNGPCAAVTTTTSLLITPISTVNAGTNTLVCSSNGSIALSGTVNPGTAIWTTGGAGVFQPNNLVTNPVYVLAPGDILAGFVNFTLSSANNGPCPSVIDSVQIPLQDLAVVSAGPSQSLCATTTTFNLVGNISGGTNTGFWTTDGSGTFNPGPTFLNNIYTITPGDISAGIITFTLSSTNNGPCPAVTNTLSLSFFSLAIVNAGINQLLCSNVGTIGLNGSSTNMGSWTTNGSGAFIPNNSFLNATYSITAADILAGSVSFTLTSSNSGFCPVVQDSVKIAFQNLAIVSSGPSSMICSSTGSVILSGNISGGGTSTGIWSSNGTGVFNPGVTSLNTNYFVSFADVNAGVLIFTLTSLNNGPCVAVEDTMMLTIFKIAVVNSGPNQALCSNIGTVSLVASITSLSNTGMWSATGTGTFVPDNLSLNTIYMFTPNDINAGAVTFSFSSTNNGPCPSVVDSVKITIRKIAVVSAGPDLAICSTTNAVKVIGNVIGYSPTGVWSTNANGTFSPNINTLNVVYNLTPQDFIIKSVTLILSSTNNGVCPIVRDTVNITLFNNPVLVLAPDTTICSNQNPLRVSSYASGDYGLLQWSSSGSGNFSPNNLANPVNYDISGDVAANEIFLTVSTLNNSPCGNKSASMKVTIRPTPIANFTASKFTASVPNDPINFTNQSINATKYNWDFGDGNSTNAVNPKHNYTEIGYYNVVLIAINQYGCSDTATKEVIIVSDIQFPNVFTPNLGGPNGGAYNVNDYSNDVFFPYTSGVTEYNLKIFNRWGELIFESFELKVGWDGYFKGKLCQQDGYVWKADVKFFDGRTYNKTGSVTLLR